MINDYSDPKSIKVVDWQDNHLRLLDQTKLPVTLEYLDCYDVQTVWQAIKDLVVRGAPAIGVSAAYAVLLDLWRKDYSVTTDLITDLNTAADYLATSRPTAVNLFWALDAMRQKAAELADQPVKTVKDRLLAAAQAIRDDDASRCAQIGQCGLQLIPSFPNRPACILTHCNAGALATAGIGTALAPVYAAAQAGCNLAIYADETRPLLQGSRLTAWELTQANIDVTVICDNMAAVVMSQGKIDLVIIGADRISANGDVANKIGSLGVAILAHYFNIPFYVAAPWSTFDLQLSSGKDIPIEERNADEIRCGMGKLTAPAQVKTYNPAFDVIPAELVTGIITEKGYYTAQNGALVKATGEVK